MQSQPSVALVRISRAAAQNTKFIRISLSLLLFPLLLGAHWTYVASERRDGPMNYAARESRPVLERVPFGKSRARREPPFEQRCRGLSIYTMRFEFAARANFAEILIRSPR